MANARALRVTRWCLKRLLRKSIRTTVPLSGPAARKNDDFEIRIEGFPVGSEVSYLIRSLEGDTLKVTRWEGETQHDRTFSLGEVPYESYIVRHFYSTWQIHYRNMRVAAIYDLFRINRFRRLIQRQWDRGLSFRQDRYDLLRFLLKNRKPRTSKTPSVYDLLGRLYGQRIRLSDRMPEYLDDFRFRLDSLSETGEIQIVGDTSMAEVHVLPRALVTLSEYETESRRHRTIVAVNILQVVVAAGTLALAASTLWMGLRSTGVSPSGGRVEMTSPAAPQESLPEAPPVAR